jgi:hypothetical protein
VNGRTIDLTDVNYGGSHAAGTLVVSPEDATVVYTGETIVPEGSTTLNLAAVVTQADDGSPGDLTRAMVQFEVYDQGGTLVTAPVIASVSSDGTCEATAAVPGAETYLVRSVVVGGYFASSPSLPMSGLTIEPTLFQVNAETTASALFGDPDGFGIVKAIWDWDDGTTCDTSLPESPCSLVEPSPLTPGQVIGYHAYTDAGIYTVQLIIIDGSGNTAQALYRFIVVYDLAAGEGFVTGGGWIWSEALWCDPSYCGGAEGKANFGFVSRYKKGANAPTGTTEFNFSAGGLNFHSDAYDWLVVNQAGTNAQFKGAGTINGEGVPGGELYNFMIWAQDQDPDDDAFRIKIWYEEGGNEVIVYDNGFDQILGGGSIVIHQGD